MSLRRWLSLISLVSLIGVTACAPSAPEGGPETGDATLRIATTTDLVSFNPYVGNTRTDGWVTNLMYPRLLTIADDGSKAPLLATDWGYTDPQKGFYEIHDGMEWSDGKPLTAEDVAYSLNAVKQDEPEGTLGGQMGNFASAEAVSTTRVEVTLSAPDATLMDEIGFWANVVPQHVFEPAGGVAEFANASDWVSAGPYILTEVQPGQSYTMERVTPYPLADDGIPNAERIVWQVYPDVNTEILALKNGDVDLIANALPPSQVDTLRDAEGITVQEVPGLGYAHMAYNMDRPPLDDVLVRQALAHAVDYEAIREVVLHGQAESTGSSPLFPTLGDYYDPSVEEYQFDPQLSRRLLEQAGHSADSDGNFPLSFRLLYSLTDPVWSETARIVKEEAAKAGITIELQGLEHTTFLAKRAEGDYDIYIGDWAVLANPITNFAYTYLPTGSINLSHVDDPEINQLVETARTTLDLEERVEIMRRAARIVHDNVYDNVMYSRNLFFAHRSEWSGFLVEPSELLSIVNANSLANATKQS